MSNELVYSSHKCSQLQPVFFGRMAPPIEMMGEPVTEGMSEDGTIRFTYANGDCKSIQSNGDIHYQYESGDVQQYCECSLAQ